MGVAGLLPGNDIPLRLIIGQVIGRLTKHAAADLAELWVAAAWFRDRGEKRTKVLVPDSAHGTNPASATMAGFETVTVKTLPSGTLDMEDFRRRLDDQIAVFMITNPNTVGIFEPHGGVKPAWEAPPVAPGGA